MVDATRRKIISVKSEDANRSVILVGVGVSAAIASQVCTFSISAIVAIMKTCW